MATVKDLGGSYARNAGADLSTKILFLAKIDTDGDIVLAAAGTDVVAGVITEAASENYPVTILYDGEGKCYAGGNITAGARLTSDGNGKAVATTTAGDKVFGTAKDTVLSGEVVPFIFQRGHVAAS